MQVRKASEILSLVAFSGRVAGPAWAEQFFDNQIQDEDGAANPEAERQEPQFFPPDTPCEGRC